MTAHAAVVTDDLRRVPAQTFLLGSDRHYPEEGPAHPVTVAETWIERHPVTNAQFARFVRDTGYRTVAERPLDTADFPGAPAENLVPGSLVFTPTPGPVDLRHLDQWWTWTPGAHWRRPEGPGSSLRWRPDHPVVHVALEDARAYATWAGRVLPSEAQWEAAARGGLDGAAYCWGDEPETPGEPLANHWRGPFPWRPDPGSGTTTPVGRFPPNGYDLVDMAGNVWEWTRDAYTDHRAPGAAEPPTCCGATGPRAGGAHHVVKGGSFLCADEYCRRYRPAARRPQAVDTGMSHLGFRCAAPGP